MTLCHQHGNPILPPGEPWPAGGWSPYCPPGCGRAKVTARGPCLHLGPRTEFRPGCGGRMCLHTCEAGEPVAVPGGVCLSCHKWEPEN